MPEGEKQNEQGASKSDTKASKTLHENHPKSGGNKLGVHIMWAAIACSLWWIFGTQFAYIALPLIIISLLAMAFTMKYFRTAIYKYSAIFILYIFLSPFLISGFSFVLTFILSSTTTYSIVYEFKTPVGKRVVTNKITVTNGDNPIVSLRSFYNGQSSVKAAANVVMLTDGKGVIPLLSPSKDRTFLFLKIIPDWIESPQRSIQTEDGTKGYLLTETTTPGVVCMHRTGTLESYTLANKGSLESTFGPGYAFIRAWVAFGDVEQLCNLKDTVIWWNYERNRPKKGLFPFDRLGIKSSQIAIDEYNTPVFLRI